MKSILEQYFIEYGQLDLLSWGCLKWQMKPASFNEKGIDAPIESILFDPIASLPSKHFYTYLADSLGISTEQAIIQYELFIQGLFEGQQEEINMESLGSFVNNNGILNWVSHFVSSQYYSNIYLDKVTNQNVNEEVFEEDKDNWVLMASIIAILSLLAILFKFYH